MIILCSLEKQEDLQSWSCYTILYPVLSALSLLIDNSLGLWYCCCKNIVRSRQLIFMEWSSRRVFHRDEAREAFVDFQCLNDIQHTVNTIVCPWAHWEISPWDPLQLEASQQYCQHLPKRVGSASTASQRSEKYFTARWKHKYLITPTCKILKLCYSFVSIQFSLPVGHKVRDRCTYDLGYKPVWWRHDRVRFKRDFQSVAVTSQWSQ